MVKLLFNKESIALTISFISLIVSILVYRNNKSMKQLTIQPEFIIRQLTNRINERETIHISLLNKGSLRVTDLSAEWVSTIQRNECDIYISEYKKSRKGKVLEEGITPIIDLRNITGNVEKGYLIVNYRDALGKKKKVYSPIIKIENDIVINEMDIKNQFLSDKFKPKLN